MTKSNEQLTAEIQQLRTTVNGISAQLSELKQNINSRPMLSDLSRSEANLSDQIKANSELITKIEQQLATVIVPEDTRYYLEESEVGDFRSNFNKLLAMMASFDQLYKNLAAYSVNNVTNK